MLHDLEGELTQMPTPEERLTKEREHKPRLDKRESQLAEIHPLKTHKMRPDLAPLIRMFLEVEELT